MSLASPDQASILPTGKCYDNAHNLVETGCFDIPTATEASVSYYPSLNGFTLSSQFKGHPALNNQYWTVAPKMTSGPGAASPR